MKIKEYLKSIGKTQQQFAKEIGVSNVTITRAVKGYCFGSKTAKKIVDASGGLVTYNDIYN